MAYSGYRDSTVALYSPSFDPDNPSTNLIDKDDDSGSISNPNHNGVLSYIEDVNLTPGTYYVIVSGCGILDINLPTTYSVEVRSDDGAIAGGDDSVSSIPANHEWLLALIAALMILSVMFKIHLKKNYV